MAYVWCSPRPNATIALICFRFDSIENIRQKYRYHAATSSPTKKLFFRGRKHFSALLGDRIGPTKGVEPSFWAELRRSLCLGEDSFILYKRFPKSTVIPF